MSGRRVPAGLEPVPGSACTADGVTYVLVSTSEGRFLFASASDRLPDGRPAGGGSLHSLSPETARALQEIFSWLVPRRIPDDGPSFGFGDRIGLATPGHLRAVRSTGVFPIIAQQSVRENTRTGRSFAEVLADAVFGAFHEGYRGGFGADADHLKTIDDALEAAALGFSFFTCDPGDHVVAVESMTTDEVHARFAALPDGEDLLSRYAGKTFIVGDGLVLRFSTEELERAAVKYGGAISHAVAMAQALNAARPGGVDYEVSVDETEEPTAPLEHLFVALELRHRGVDFNSLAPRFVGAMEKGVDWRGDRARFDTELHKHALIARSVGGYRLSLHSGSDKFSLYPAIARETRGALHVKTAGTSYLVALDGIARWDPPLFREIAAESLAAFSRDCATYHLSADPARIPAIETLPDEALPDLVSVHDSRQVLHVAYGSILRGGLAHRVRACLFGREAEYHAALVQHFNRHLAGLEVSAYDGS